MARSSAADAPLAVIGAAVLRAARRSTGLGRGAFARRIGACRSNLWSWEAGIRPLYAVSYDQLSGIANALCESRAAVGRDACELIVAAQCDLLIAGMLQGFEDYAEVPPVDHGPSGDAARGLLRWALEGTVPKRYQRYASAGALLPPRQVAAFAAVAREVQAGVHGPDLVSYGTALLDLVPLRHRQEA